MTLETQFQKNEQKAVRAALWPVLMRSHAELKAGPVGIAPDTFIAFLAELARALLKFRKHPKGQRRELRRIVQQPRRTDAELLQYLLELHLFPRPRRPNSPALQ